MSDQFELAREQLLRPAGLGDSELHRALDAMMGRGVDAADLYFQSRRNESWVLEDGMIKEGAFSIDAGVGVRAMSGEKSGFAYADEIQLDTLLEASGNARAIARSGADGGVGAEGEGGGGGGGVAVSL